MPSVYTPTDPANLNASLKALLGLKQNFDPVTVALHRDQEAKDLQRNLELAASNPRYSVAGAVPSDVSNLKADLAEDPFTGTAAQATQAEAEKNLTSRQDFLSPLATQVREKQQADALALKTAEAKQLGENTLAVTKQQQDPMMKFLEGASAPGGGPSAIMGGPGATLKPSFDTAGRMSLSVQPMAALVQRAHNQLMDARDKTLGALKEAEANYPGINDAVVGVDKPGGSALGRLFSTVTGMGAPKYGSATDAANARLERLNYSMGVPTPFSKLAQEASFGNIEQMAGQLPGVRGLATITPMFKEHQSRWGHETPLATVQRLRHMVDIMDQTLGTIESSGGSAPSLGGGE